MSGAYRAKRLVVMRAQGHRTPAGALQEALSLALGALIDVSHLLPSLSNATRYCEGVHCLKGSTSSIGLLSVCATDGVVGHIGAPRSRLSKTLDAESKVFP